MGIWSYLVVCLIWLRLHFLLILIGLPSIFDTTQLVVLDLHLQSSASSHHTKEPMSSISPIFSIRNLLHMRQSLPSKEGPGYAHFFWYINFQHHYFCSTPFIDFCSIFYMQQFHVHLLLRVLWVGSCRMKYGRSISQRIKLVGMVRDLS
jgi:hypothetical protein